MFLPACLGLQTVWERAEQWSEEAAPWLGLCQQPIMDVNRCPLPSEVLLSDCPGTILRLWGVGVGVPTPRPAEPLPTCDF